jgi:hypothetical protein
MRVQILPRELGIYRTSSTVSVGCGHESGCPAFDPAVKVCTPMDVDAEAAVIVLAHVLPYRPWVVVFQGRRAELIGRCPSNPEPELLVYNSLVDAKQVIWLS